MLRPVLGFPGHDGEIPVDARLVGSDLPAVPRAVGALGTDGRGVREICDALDLDTGTLSPLLKRLETLGLVERRRSSADERRVGIHLTEKGAALRAAAEGIPAELADSTGMEIDELVALRDTLSRLTESLHSFTTPTGEK